MSMNEELQSANEELEASKEEMQSLNEELTTVNSQFAEKVADLTATNNDLANLLGATDIATVFLDRQLRIKRFTPRATELLNLIPGDIGRPFGHITQNFSGEDAGRRRREGAQEPCRAWKRKSGRATAPGTRFESSRIARWTTGSTGWSSPSPT